MATTIAFVSGKGGVGKTSLAVNTAYTLARMNLTVLLIDLDTTPTGTLELGLADETDGNDRGESLAVTLLTGRPLAPHHRGPNLHVIPGGRTLSTLPGMEATWKDSGLEVSQVLRERVTAPLADTYDYIIIDTPPGGAANASRLALGAADYAIVPTRDDTGSMQGIADAIAQCTDARTWNPQLCLLGVVLFDIDRRATVEIADAVTDVEHLIAGHATLFTTVIHDSKKAARRARKAGMPVLEYDQTVVTTAKPWYQDTEKANRKIAKNAGKLAMDYLTFTGEMLDRITRHQQQTATTTAAGAHQ